MSFQRQHDELGDSAISLDSLEHSLRLNRKCARIVVIFTMDHQDRVLDFVGMHKR